MKKIQLTEHEWTRQNIWEGCILASIAHAVFIADAPDLAYEHSWDGDNYSTNDGQGSRGTVAFGQEVYAAGFRNDHLALNPVDAKQYFIEAPDQVQQTAEQETLQYLLDEVDGEVRPVVTTVLWESEQHVFSSHPYDIMLERGADLLEVQASEYEAAIEFWEENYELTEQQLALVEKLYHLKLEDPTRRILLTEEDIQSINANDVEGIEESRCSFSEIGIEWPS
ncbi:MULTISPECIES: hypothetical protein [unclassified Exiguobacterium]|uniref:hypothetical protein n=1 Tax=unclassified Exiguobacterium TaxID=2644629 RepID=UPI00103F96D3|nr:MULTISPECIES: hypothetical protein [unclassified Exiguobacterium]TCI71348.1 hypothetical protein EVJ19_05615 [Exiguobacterium sp. IPCI3]TCI81326.1 hypothetical protein EVJ18_05615 [Exiguobacterium sp. IPCH1]TCI82523.1 hypothetical protein EVJ17_05615 [Exiguobacterium sp. IPBC4]